MSVVSTSLYQRVFTLEQTVPFSYGTPFILPLYYETSDGDQNLSGLTLNIHYNSSLIAPDVNGVSSLHQEGITKVTPIKDTNNLDGDLSTDSILQLLWVSFDSSFPGISLPALLANVSWMPAPPSPNAGGLPPIASGEGPTTTVIRYTASEVADGYHFQEDYTVVDLLPSPPVDPNPDYSNDPLNPTPITWSGVVAPYQGLISNSVGESDSADYLTFTVLPGQKLTGITLTAYNSTDGKAFIGLQPGAQVTASSSNPEPLIGYTHFGSGQADAVVGTNLINKLGGVLTEGTYSIWIQQLGAKTDYSFDLQLEDNPTIFEPNAVILPTTTTGTKVTIADTSSPEVVATSQSSPDLIEIKAPVTATLNALTTERYGVGLVARNVGTTTNEGTGQNIPLIGIGKYTFVATAIPEATTTINLEPAKDTAFFLHDAYSAFCEGLTLTADSTGRQSHQRVLNVDTIFMGSGGGTSIVDLTSKDYVTGAVTVYGADKGRSIFWGTDANDTFISGGGDSVIFGGAGSNSASLGTGRDTLQYRLGVGAVDQISGFDPAQDVVELWVGKYEADGQPQFNSVNGSTFMYWHGITVEFLGVPDRTDWNLQIINRIV